MVPILTNLSNGNNYGARRDISKIKYIIIHGTGNDGDSAESNGRYFKNNIVKASANYFVDDDSIVESVPVNYVPYSVGGSRYSNYKTTGGARLYKVATNTNSINIELCDTVKNGVIHPSDKTIQNTIEFVKSLMAKYSIPLSNVIRHFDVNGKPCPSYWTNNDIWNAEFLSKINESSISKPIAIETSKGSCPFFEPTATLKNGSKGEGVKWLQWYLRSFGYIWIADKNNNPKELTVDGDFGYLTEKAVRHFQLTNMGKLYEDGKVGKLTRAKIKDIYSKRG